MTTRRAFISGVLGAGATLVVAGCSDDPSSAPGPTGPTRDEPGAGSSAASTVPSTAGPVTSPSASPTTAAADPPATTAAVSAPWSGADFDGLDRFLEEAQTDAFRLVEGGTVIHEWYRTDSAFGRDVASAQKSILSLLVGRAVSDQLVELDTRIDDVLGNGWTPHGQTSGITVRHLLTMTSGLDDQFAVIAAPGAEWQYSGAFASLFDVLTTVTGRDLNDLADEWLFAPAGARTAEFYERRSSRLAPVGLFATASDLTAIGQSVVDRSQPRLAPGLLDESLLPSQAINEAYGYLWWLNGQESFRLPGASRPRSGWLIPSAPADVVAALGKDDQKLYVSRELGLVAARLGEKASAAVRPALSTFDDSLWSMLLALRSA